MMNRNNRSEWMWMLAAGLVVAPLTLSGCGKKEPPPPPQERASVQPPPPPSQADVAALLQEMNADSRVQFPGEVAPIDVDYARAIISFASSFAQGDEVALGGMLDFGGQETLNTLVESGAWYDETDTVEAVRVVYVAEPMEDDGSSYVEDAGPDIGGMLTAESLRDDMLQQIIDEGVTAEEIIGNLGNPNLEGAGGMTPAQLEQMAVAMLGADLVAQLKDLETEFAQGGMTPEDMVNAMYDRGLLASMAEKTGAMMASLGAAVDQFGAAMGADTSGGAELRLAIQEPGAAYALNFTAREIGGRYIFSPAPEANVIRVRASDFFGRSEGVGSFGQGLSALDFSNPAGNPDATPSESESTEGGGGPSPTRPNVPTGPSSPGGG